MSDIVIVSASTFKNGYAPSGHVPYGSILDDEDGMAESDGRTIEAFYDGSVPAVDWRGIGEDVPVTPAKRGRPRKETMV
jgi:hypothetical protein